MSESRPSASKIAAEVARLVLQYICAIFVAFVVALIIVIAIPPIMGVGLIQFVTDTGPADHVVIPLIAGTAAFAGTLAGSACLYGRSRSVACVVLTILGLLYYYCHYDLLKADFFFDQFRGVPLMLPLAAGGLCALLFTILTSFLRGRRTQKSPVANKPSNFPI